MRSLSTYLTYAGSLPFVFGAICSILGYHQLPIIGNITQVITVYTIVIAGFMAGIHWGHKLHLTGKIVNALALVSNLNAIVLWLSASFLPLSIFNIIAIVIFALILFIDWLLKQQNTISAEYFKTRFIVTTIVILSLMVSGVF